MASYSRCSMAKAVEHALRTDAADGFDWTYVSPDGLSVTEAWALATTWQAEVRGLAYVSLDKRRPRFTVVPNYEWIVFELPDDASPSKDLTDVMSAVVAARASSLVWRALAECRGFGAREHPVFWRHLFDTTQVDPQRPSGSSTRDGVRGDDRFFDGVAFPRFKIVLPHARDDVEWEQLVRVFCGLDDANEVLHEDSKTSQQMDEILTRLEPLLRTSQMGPVELSLQFSKINTDALRVNDIINQIETRSSTVPGNESLPRAGKLLTQPYVVQIENFSEGWADYCRRKNVDWARYVFGQEIDWDLRGSGVMWTQLWVGGLSTYWSLSFRIEFQQFVRWSLDVDGLSPVPSGVRHLILRYSTNATDRGAPVNATNRGAPVSAICSALPQARSLQMLEMGAATFFQSFNKFEFAWICYALFHPGATTSTWRDLTLQQLDNGDASSLEEVPDLMSKGNNLHVVLGYSTTRADGYYSATIREGAVIHESAGDEQAVIQVLESPTQMDVCVASPDLTQVDEWVFVVLVGFGEAWVRSSWIDEIVYRPAGRSAITRLSLEPSCPVFVKLVSVAGSALTYLSLENGYANSDESETIRNNCPRLETLRLRYTYDRVHELEFPPSLRELELCLTSNPSRPVDLDFSKTSLHKLRDLVSLRITTRRSPTDADVIKFVQPLLRALPGLMRFSWIDLHSEADANILDKKTYVMNRSITRAILHPLEFGRDDVAVVRSAPSESIVALLSVVERRRQDSSAMGLLSREVITMVAKFVGTKVARDLWVFGGRHQDLSRESASYSFAF